MSKTSSLSWSARSGGSWAARERQSLEFIEPFRTSSTVEQAAVNRKVQGSNPWSGANCKFDFGPPRRLRASARRLVTAIVRRLIAVNGSIGRPPYRSPRPNGSIPAPSDDGRRNGASKTAPRTSCGNAPIARSIARSSVTPTTDESMSRASTHSLGWYLAYIESAYSSAHQVIVGSGLSAPAMAGRSHRLPQIRYGGAALSRSPATPLNMTPTPFPLGVEYVGTTPSAFTISGNPILSLTDGYGLRMSTSRSK